MPRRRPVTPAALRLARTMTMPLERDLARALDQAFQDGVSAALCQVEEALYDGMPAVYRVLAVGLGRLEETTPPRSTT